MLARDSLLLDLGHPAECVKDLGNRNTLRHKHAQVLAISGKHPALARDSILPVLGHPAVDEQDPGYCKTLRTPYAPVRAFFK